jgi:hypothetical protein
MINSCRFGVSFPFHARCHKKKAIGDTLLSNRLDVFPNLVVIYIWIFMYRIENASQNGAWNVKEISNTEPSEICGLTVMP